MTAGIVLAGAPSCAEHKTAPSAYREVVTSGVGHSGSYQGAFERLEPDDAKVSRPVPRGPGGSNAPLLPDRHPTPSPKRVRMRLLAEKEKGVPDAQPSKNLARLSAAVSFVVGFILVLNDSGAGWFLIIMGIVYIGASTRAGQELAASNPSLVRRGLVGVTLLLVLLTVVVGAVLLLK